jgi:hypothetical protein
MSQVVMTFEDGEYRNQLSDSDEGDSTIFGVVDEPDGDIWAPATEGASPESEH